VDCCSCHRQATAYSIFFYHHLLPPLTNAKKENKRELAFAVFLFYFYLSVLFSFLFVFSLLLLRA